MSNTHARRCPLNLHLTPASSALWPSALFELERLEYGAVSIRAGFSGGHPARRVLQTLTQHSVLRHRVGSCLLDWLIYPMVRARSALNTELPPPSPLYLPHDGSLAFTNFNCVWTVFGGRRPVSSLRYEAGRIRHLVLPALRTVLPMFALPPLKPGALSAHPAAASRRIRTRPRRPQLRSRRPSTPCVQESYVPADSSRPRYSPRPSRAYRRSVRRRSRTTSTLGDGLSRTNSVRRR